jgi:hypothetical protein
MVDKTHTYGICGKGTKRSYIPILTFGYQSRYLPPIHNGQLHATGMRHLGKIEEKKYEREDQKSNDEKGWIRKTN